MHGVGFSVEEQASTLPSQTDFGFIPFSTFLDGIPDGQVAFVFSFYFSFFHDTLNFNRWDIGSWSASTGLGRVAIRSCNTIFFLALARVA